MVDRVIDMKLRELQLATDAKRSRNDDVIAAVEAASALVERFEILGYENDVEGAMELLNEAVRLARELRALGGEAPEEAAEDLDRWASSIGEAAREFIGDQCENKLVVWDLETDRLVPSHGSGYKLEDLNTTVLALLAVDIEEAAANPADAIANAERFEFWHPEANGAPLELTEVAFEAARANVAYNGIGFDSVVIKKHFKDEQTWKRLQATMIDPLVDIRTATGRRFKLDALLTANSISNKTEQGSIAPELWRTGQLKRLARYCMADAEKLAELVLRPSIQLPETVRGMRSVPSRVFGMLAPSKPATPQPTPVPPERVEQRSPEWFALRKNRVTSTLVGAICGLSPFMDREEAHETLRGENEQPRIETEAMRRGIEREAEAIRRYEAATGNSIEEVGFVIPTDERYASWTGASPDGLGREDEQLCLEVKVPGNGRPVAKPSPSYFLQCQWHLFCSGRSYCDFVSLGSQEMTIARIRRDEDLLAFILPHLRVFWEHAQTNDEFALEFDMRDRIGVRQEVKDSLEASVGPVRVVKFV
jgi:putative phage-type endonuclease